MAIKVIQEGSMPTIKCKHCGSLLAFQKTDTLSTNFGEHIRKIICPICGFELYFDSRDIKAG